ncbi:hypothetical protein [Pseudolysinimonas kribbensis]|uniref:hypothetical protein n=1 Tax=Pseudolysinimonas kribbensis TaxID=433641 RepID=UPI0024E062CC|nr:hypothetical protein [Pseudolysinimonas kribbensis]
MLKKILAGIAAVALGAGISVAAAATAAHATEPTQCVVGTTHVDEVSHQEYRYDQVVPAKAETFHTEYRFHTRVHRPDNTVERKFVKGYDFVDGGTVTFRDQNNHSQTVSGHWVKSDGWHQIPDSVINAYWGAGGITQSLLGGSEDHPKGMVPLSVYGGPNVSVSYYASEETITGGYTDYGPWSDWSTTNPGASTDTMEVQSEQVSNHDGTTEYTLYYVHGHSPSTDVDAATWETAAPGAPWAQFDERKVVDTAAHDTDKYADCVQPCSAFGTITTMANPDGTLPSTWNTSDTRSKGSNTVTGGVLNVATQDSSGESKAAAYYAVDIPLASIGSPHLNYASTPAGVLPGFQLVLDDGRILVGEPGPTATAGGRSPRSRACPPPTAIRPART